LAVTLAFPDAVLPRVKEAVAENIPAIAINAGADQWKPAGMLGYVGTEEFLSGMAVGKRLSDAGFKNVVCLNQEQGAIQLEERCDGIAKTLKGKMSVVYVPGMDMASTEARLAAKLQQDPSVDFVVALNAPFVTPILSAISTASSRAHVGTFGIDPTSLRDIAAGKADWAIDIQPYLQGYEAVDLLYLYKVNGDILGGGGSVLIGPNFITKADAGSVLHFATLGTR
jgi:simple sugar transport system substrate-binding protein